MAIAEMKGDPGLSCGTGGYSIVHVLPASTVRSMTPGKMSGTRNIAPGVLGSKTMPSWIGVATTSRRVQLSPRSELRWKKPGSAYPITLPTYRPDRSTPSAVTETGPGMPALMGRHATSVRAASDAEEELPPGGAGLPAATEAATRSRAEADVRSAFIGV